VEKLCSVWHGSIVANLRLGLVFTLQSSTASPSRNPLTCHVTCPKNLRAFLWALLPASCELQSFVAFKPLLAALNEEIPQLFQTHHAAGMRIGALFLLLIVNL
jgi:hypothetical protein